MTARLIVLLCVCRYNNKTYRIDDIDFEKNPTTKFLGRNDQEMSFVEYYKKVSHVVLFKTGVFSSLDGLSFLFLELRP